MSRVVVIYPSGYVFACTMDEDTIDKSHMLVDSVGAIIIDFDFVLTKRSRYVYQEWVDCVSRVLDTLEYPICTAPNLQQAKKYVISDL
jgi:hypothetical protein